MNLFDKAIAWVQGKFIKTINYESIYGEGNISAGGGGGGFEPTEAQLTAMNSGIDSTKVGQIATNTTNINNKLDKLTDTGEFVYSHDGNVQTSKGFEVADEPSGSAAHVTSSKTVKAVKEAAKEYTDSKVKYLHTMIRYNEDSKEIVMGWWKYIDDKETATVDDFKNFLKNNGYTSKEHAWHWCGGCAGTLGVRNSADTGTTYVGKIVSGVFYVEAEDSMYFKYDYNGTTTIVWARVDIVTEQI